MLHTEHCTMDNANCRLKTVLHMTIADTDKHLATIPRHNLSILRRLRRHGQGEHGTLLEYSTLVYSTAVYSTLL